MHVALIETKLKFYFYNEMKQLNNKTKAPFNAYQEKIYKDIYGSKQYKNKQ